MRVVKYVTKYEQYVVRVYNNIIHVFHASEEASVFF